jgi:predicted helicase
VLNKHFGKSLASEGVHILDPFTGTGTFIVRTLTYLKEKMDAGEITLADITRKFTQELHANEIVLLSYYIAAINIEATFDDINGDAQGYVPFEGIVLTDTFESTENEDALDDTYFGTNDERLKRQQEVPITAIIANPPYSTGQNNENEDNQNIHYPKLEEKIQQTYSKYSSAKLKQALYDSYIKAFRWSSDRFNGKGVIGFVTNGAYIDNQSMDGFRKCLYEEFNYLYIFNLRGDQRTQGELSRKEGGKIFGSGSRASIAISLLVKDGSDNHEIFYHDIGDYLSREKKLEIINDFGTVSNIEWKNIVPDKNNDWINQRDQAYESYDVLQGLEKSFFEISSLGIQTARDAWVIGYSKEKTISNTERMVSNYNNEVDRLANVTDKKIKLSSINKSDNFIKWSDVLKNMLVANKNIQVNRNEVVTSMYRPFSKKYLYYNEKIIHRARNYKNVFGENNKIIFITGTGISKDFSSLMIDVIPNYHTMDTGKGFFLKNSSKDNALFGGDDSNITSYIKNKLEMTDEDVFYYVYGVLHSSEYRTKYANDLRKAFPRIPVLKNKEKYVEIGRKLANLHLNYENQPSWDGVEVQITGPEPNYRVKKMKHRKKGILDTIIFNENITIKNIPDEAYEYVINGRPAIEWIIDQYQVKTDKKSGITDDPNEFSDDPKYILNLLLSVITVSMKTIELVGQLPKFEVVDDSQTHRDEFYPLDDDLTMVAKKSDENY